MPAARLEDLLFPASTARIRGFDGLRAIAFLLVFVSHKAPTPFTDRYGTGGVGIFSRRLRRRSRDDRTAAVVTLGLHQRALKTPIAVKSSDERALGICRWLHQSHDSRCAG
jgi:hypothetical protein